MLVFKHFENNEFSILDTEDGSIEQISGEDLLSVFCTTNLEIQGLSLNSKGFIIDAAKTVLYKPSKVKNNNLLKAKKAKNDEFYTQLSDIEKELAHYPIETFKDKVIYCPMDVATNTGKILQSQFVKYFQLNAHRLQFKKLIATCLVDKAAGEGVALEDAQNCYILERKQVDSIQRNIYGYTHGDGNSNPVIEEVDDFGLKYKTKDQNEHAIPYHIVNQAVTDSSGKIVIVKKYIDHYDEETGKPVLSDENKGLTWMFEGYPLSIKWCRKHPDGTIEMLPDECYFLNNNDIISDFSVFPKDEHGTPCFENISNGSVCLAPPEYYDYQEVDYNDYEEYFSHCPEDSSEFGGSGDFRSEYCTRLLQEADIVVTNPPFSLFRDFVKWLVNANKKFIILGNKASTTYADIFTLFRDGKCRLGYSIHSGERYFIQPDTDELSKGISVRWFTNLFYSNTVDKLILLSKEENEERNVVYSRLDNYDAINVNKYKDIPSDFTSIMAVPVSFFDYWCPEQFELLGLTNSSPDLCYCKTSDESDTRAKINGKAIYARVLIRHRKDENGKLV